MKHVTLSFWIPENETIKIGEYGRITTAELIRIAGLSSGDVRQMTNEDIVRAADNIAVNEYRDTVQGIIDDLKSEVTSGNITDRDSALEYLEQSIDGCHDVIYTHAAQEVLRQSRNDGAYFEDFGSDGAMSSDGIEWSKLAYCALRADVLEAIGDLDEWFQCSDCNGSVTAEDIKIAGDNLPMCADCREPENEDETEDETDEDDTAE